MRSWLKSVRPSPTCSEDQLTTHGLRYLVTKAVTLESASTSTGRESSLLRMSDQGVNRELCLKICRELFLKLFSKRNIPNAQAINRLDRFWSGLGNAPDFERVLDFNKTRSHWRSTHA